VDEIKVMGKQIWRSKVADKYRPLYVVVINAGKVKNEERVFFYGFYPGSNIPKHYTLPRKEFIKIYHHVPLKEITFTTKVID